MHSTHIILVNLHDDIEEVESSNELRKYAIMKAENETDRFFGHVFDSRRLLKEGEDGDFPVPVVLSQENWQLFEEYLLAVDRAQKQYAESLMNRVKANTGTSDLCQHLRETFLSHDRTASAEEIVKNHWEWDECADTPWKINIVADLMHGMN